MIIKGDGYNNYITIIVVATPDFLFSHRLLGEYSGNKKISGPEIKILW